MQSLDTHPSRPWVAVPFTTSGGARGSYQLPRELYLITLAVLEEGFDQIIVARNEILERVANHPEFSATEERYNVIASFVQPQFIADLQSSLHHPQERRRPFQFPYWGDDDGHEEGDDTSDDDTSDSEDEPTPIVIRPGKPRRLPRPRSLPNPVPVDEDVEMGEDGDMERSEPNDGTPLTTSPSRSPQLGLTHSASPQDIPLPAFDPNVNSLVIQTVDEAGNPIVPASQAFDPNTHSLVDRTGDVDRTQVVKRKQSVDSLFDSSEEE